jgi:hypothetical protein
MRPPERPTISTWPRTSQITTQPYLKIGVRYGAECVIRALGCEGG